MNNKEYTWLWNITKPQHFRMMILIVGHICISMLSVFFALMTKNVLDAAIRNNELFSRYSLMLIAIVLLQYALHAFLNYEDECASASITKDLRMHLMKNQMTKEYADVTRYHSGEWMNRMFSDVRIIARDCVHIFPNLAGMLSRLLFACVALLYLEPVFAAIYLCGGIMMILVIGMLRKIMKTYHRAAMKKEDKVHSFLQELTENILIIKSFNAAQHMLEKLDGCENEFRGARIKRRSLSILANTLFALTFRLGYVIVLIWGGKSLIEGLTTYGTITALLQLIGQIQSPIAQLSGVMTRIYEVSASTDRLMESDSFSETESRLPAVIDFEKIRFSDISFRYDRDLVLNHADFEIGKNDTVAISGISGGGKSTVFLLMMGIYKTDQGQILIDGKQLGKEISGKHLFAYVPQGNALFSGTIEENILFNKEYDPEKLKRALYIADAAGFVESLPEGLKTEIKENGTGLSEGQAQRIAIARAIYNDAPVLMLDEATSALDEPTEKKVLSNIKELKDKTVLIVTHRKAALQICNRHMIMTNGRIEEQ